MSLLNFVCSSLVETYLSEISPPIPPTIIILLKKGAWCLKHFGNILISDMATVVYDLFQIIDIKQAQKQEDHMLKIATDLMILDWIHVLERSHILDWSTDSWLTLYWLSPLTHLTLYWVSTGSLLTLNWLSNDIYLFSTDFYWHLLTLYWLSVESLDWLSKIVWDQHQHQYHHKESEKVS